MDRHIEYNNALLLCIIQLLVYLHSIVIQPIKKYNDVITKSVISSISAIRTRRTVHLVFNNLVYDYKNKKNDYDAKYND